MLDAPKHEIMVVDDDAAIRDSLALVLKSGGYDTTTAVNGFDALLQLKRRVPAIVLSDLNMPQMSGFEFLSVVRRRFPQISVIAMSGAYHAEEAIPGGVIADAFYPKGHSDPEIWGKRRRTTERNSNPDICGMFRSESTKKKIRMLRKEK